MYFLAIKPQKKQQKAQQQLMDSIEIGDYVLTTSGFYGVIMDITDDDVIVEFGNNKTAVSPCRRKPLQVKKKAKEFGRINSKVQTPERKVSIPAPVSLLFYLSGITY